jgi:hypothetical protein
MLITIEKNPGPSDGKKCHWISHDRNLLAPGIYEKNGTKYDLVCKECKVGLCRPVRQENNFRTEEFHIHCAWAYHPCIDGKVLDNMDFVKFARNKRPELKVGARTGIVVIAARKTGKTTLANCFLDPRKKTHSCDVCDLDSEVSVPLGSTPAERDELLLNHMRENPASIVLTSSLSVRAVPIDKLVCKMICSRSDFKERAQLRDIPTQFHAKYYDDFERILKLNLPVIDVSGPMEFLADQLQELIIFHNDNLSAKFFLRLLHRISLILLHLLVCLLVLAAGHVPALILSLRLHLHHHRQLLLLSHVVGMIPYSSQFLHLLLLLRIHLLL